jgi:hypothetical protein
MKIRMIRLGVAAALTAGVLAGCGGGGRNDPRTPEDGGNLPPASASASTDGMVAYTALQAKTRRDTADGVDLSAYALPDDATDALAPVATPNDNAAL